MNPLRLLLAALATAVVLAGIGLALHQVLDAATVTYGGP